tara:strand:+ start:7439 stop:8776 length:1338 start_codon:yes stop_codon:yes gene_type:complete
VIMSESDSKQIPLSEIPDPRMQIRATGDQGVGGRFRSRPDEFLVEELPLFETSGSGEHLYLRIMKNGISHGDMVNRLTQIFNVSEADIGYAGMKDRRAVTQQTVSIHTDKNPPSDLGDSDLQVVWVDRHAHKLRKGQLIGNRFVIRIRDVDPLDAPRAWKMLELIAEKGLPNAYMSQRFGYRLNNHRLGVAWIEGRWKDLLDEWLGPDGSVFPDQEAAIRADYAAGRYQQAIQGSSREWWAERVALKALGDGASPARACSAVPSRIRGLWIDAAQAAIYNSVLSSRLSAGTMDQLLPGDIAWDHSRSRWLRITDEEMQEASIIQDVKDIKLSATGPLPGRRMPSPGSDILSVELQAANDARIDTDLIVGQGGARRGGRRPLRVPVRNHSLDAGIDEHGPYIRIAFDLPKGAYATGVLSEIMGLDAVEERGWLASSNDGSKTSSSR